MIAPTVTEPEKTKLCAGEVNGKTESTNKVLNDVASDPKVKADNKIRKVWYKLLFITYFAGIIWTCLHPRFSVLTGENKCRGWYVDESALDTHFTTVQSYHAPKQPPLKRKGHVSRLCDNFDHQNLTNYMSSSFDSNIICHRHADDTFDVAKVVPASSAIAPHEEAIVFVVPGSSDWTRSTFHYKLIHWFKRLGNPIEVQWLAKTVYVVSSPTTDQGVDDTVALFLDSYHATALGPKSSKIVALPHRFSGAMLRNLIVLDVKEVEVTNVGVRLDTRKISHAQFNLLPQGRRGLLPNMDLVFVIGQIFFQRATFMNINKHPKSTFFVHPYNQHIHWLQTYLGIADIPSPTQQQISAMSLEQQVRYWAVDMANLCLFACTMVMGPLAPHSPALDRGIDALTIQVQFHGSNYFARDPVSEFFQLLEYVVRALSNLHERLHHSITLYLLPSPRTFVSHVEYLLPNLLVMLPLGIRAMGIVLWGLDRLHLSAAAWTAFAPILVALLISIIPWTDTTISFDNWFAAIYVILTVGWIRQVRRYTATKDDPVQILTSMQFVGCMTAIYIHVPIAFAHGSLGYPSSMLWSPLLAFPSYSALVRNKLVTFIGLVLMMATLPPFLLVPQVFPTYTAYVRLAYIPLHTQFLMLLLARLYC